MALPLLMIVIGLIVLVWSADLFVEGAAAIARILGMSPLLIGMVVIGFGTSAPELTVSALSAWQGNPGIALGNAYGSNIANIALILGTVALISPIVVHSQVIRKELPILFAVTLIVMAQIFDGELSRTDAALQLGGLVLVMGWMVRAGMNHAGQPYDRQGIEQVGTDDIAQCQIVFALTRRNDGRSQLR